MKNDLDLAVGEIACGNQFIGRAREIEALKTNLETGASVHLVGATRIGKSSLVEKVFDSFEGAPGVAQIRLDLSTCIDAFDFWASICEEAYFAINDIAPDCSSAKELLEVRNLDDSSSSWYPRIRRVLTRSLSELKKAGCRIVVSIDEFDAVTRVFAGNPAYYQLLRSLFSENRYALNGVIITRRNLEVLEMKADDVSTFHGVFDTLRLKAFSAEDMELFYERLMESDIYFDESGCEQFEFFTGAIPYLCCLLGKQLEKECGARAGSYLVTADDVVNAHRAKHHEIWRYYNSLVVRLKEDGHLDPIIYLAFDEMRTLAYVHNRDNMMSMGYLNEDRGPSGETSYYAYSKGFMSYLRLQPLEMDTWSLLSASEKKIKALFGKVYPQFAAVTYKDVNGPNAEEAKESIRKAHPETGFSWTDQNSKFLKSSRAFMDNPSVLDTLPITFIVGRIVHNWNRRFSVYFNDEPSWKEKLELIGKVRNPVAHMHEDCIGEEDMVRCKRYMSELLSLEIE